MFSEIICPNCGHPVISGPEQGRDGPHFSLGSSHTIETIIPHTVSTDIHVPPLSNDASSGILMATPDRQDPGSGYVIEGNTESRTDHEAVSCGLWPPSSAGSGEFRPPMPPFAEPVRDGVTNLDLPFLVAGEAIPNIRSNGSTEQITIPWSVPHDPGPPASREEDEDGDDEGRRPWPVVLLGSYASAVTIALAWLLWTGHARGPALQDTMPAPTRTSDPAARMAGLTRLGEDRLTTLGRPLAVGSLEFTPLEVKVGPVKFERERPQARGGRALRGAEGKCLILRGKFKNVSQDETFAPLEREFLRQPDSGYSDTLIETGGAPIETLPLPVASEKAVVGQSFAVLRPGQSMETILVSEPEATDRVSAAMTWRIRLRVSPDQSAIVGVTFGAGDVH